MEKPLLSFSLWTPELLDPLGFFLTGNRSSYLKPLDFEMLPLICSFSLKILLV